jgi:hypothetical protein
VKRGVKVQSGPKFVSLLIKINVALARGGHCSMCDTSTEMENGSGSKIMKSEQKS